LTDDGIDVVMVPERVLQRFENDDDCALAAAETVRKS
jgi:hypothetical protein